MFDISFLLVLLFFIAPIFHFRIGKRVYCSFLVVIQEIAQNLSLQLISMVFRHCSMKNKINSSGYLPGSLLFYLLVKTQGPMKHGLATSAV